MHEIRSLRDLGGGVGSTHLPYTVRTDDTPKVRFSGSLGQEPEVEVVVVQLVHARAYFGVPR